MTAPLIDIYDRTYLNPQINTVVNDYTGLTYPMQQNIPVLLHEYYLGGIKQYQKLHNWLGNRYDASGKLLSRLLGNGTAAMKKEVLADLDIRNGDRILLLSAGNGADLDYLPAHADRSTLQITCTDISLPLLQKCRKALDKKGIQAQLVNCCLEALPFEDSYFDVVLITDGMRLCSDRQQAVSEMLRVVKRGGRVLIADETGRKEDTTPVLQLVPSTAANTTLHTYRNNKLYSVSFRKPVW